MRAAPFPRFDEPAFKATFDISLVVDTGDTAISNGPIVSDTPGPGEGKHTLTFLTTPKMSTYLVAFLVGDFQCTAGEQDGVAIRVCSTPDKVALTPYGVEVAKYVLHYYNTYFGIPYPLKKLDLIALPDFEAGAMENFGAITFRETASALDPKTASIDAKKNVALVIAHEMAHQWFGDLVTMQWWDNIWLNEGFATWMENKPIAAMHPGVAHRSDGRRRLTDTLNLDAQPTTRAIRAKADTPEEINQMFDGIAYGKAGDVLLSVENYLGEETFRQGVHDYLAAHLYCERHGRGFLECSRPPPVTSRSNKIMDVSSPSPACLSSASASPPTAASPSRRALFPQPQRRETKAAKNGPCPFASKPAAIASAARFSRPRQHRSPFPPRASSRQRRRQGLLPQRLCTGLVQGSGRCTPKPDFTPTERISLIGDEWAQVRADKASVGDYLDLVQAVKDDPMQQSSDAIGGLQALYCASLRLQGRRTHSQPGSEDFLAPLCQTGTAHTGDSPNTRELRAQLFAVLGFNGKDPSVLAQARRITEQYLADPASVRS